MDPVLLSRIQFAVTIGFHFLFPPLTIGLAWLLVIIEWKGWRRADEDAQRAGRFFARILGLIFAVGVVSGLVMEFQFGTNWAEYARFVGSIFGTHLAVEAMFAFFLESTFIAIYLFARDRVPAWLHWTAILLVAVGATVSAFWILVANSWMQTPTGYRIVVEEGVTRAELVSFWGAVNNPSMWPRFLHTMAACLTCGAFFMAGVAAWFVRCGRETAVFRPLLRLSVIASAVFAIACLFPTGHHHAVQVAETQPEKLATFEGLKRTQPYAPMLVFGIPYVDEHGEPQVALPIAVPGMLSMLVHMDPSVPVEGMRDLAAQPITDAQNPAYQGTEKQLPPFVLTFLTFHGMVGLGSAFIGLTVLALFFLRRGRIYQTPWLLRLLTCAIPLPMLAIHLGWITAEVGRQPWIVWHEMTTAEAISPNVDGGQVLFSLIMFSLLYLLLLGLFLFLLVRQIRHGPPAVGTGDHGAVEGA